jgi:SAM-dependent methyltransferase
MTTHSMLSSLKRALGPVLRPLRALDDMRRYPPSKQSQFGIKPGYRHRTANRFFDDTPLRDEWQREVYERAATYARTRKLLSVADIGCGSGFKLMKHFGEFRTIGLDLEPTVSFLRRAYPERDWRVSDLTATLEPVDVVICADVIEHIPNPDMLMRFLTRIEAQVYFVSTPERTLFYGYDHSGPPSNRGHCREWTMQELRNYLSQWFQVDEIVVTDASQATQMASLRPT